VINIYCSDVKLDVSTTDQVVRKLRTVHLPWSFLMTVHNQILPRILSFYWIFQTGIRWSTIKTRLLLRKLCLPPVKQGNEERANNEMVAKGVVVLYLWSKSEGRGSGHMMPWRRVIKRTLPLQQKWVLHTRAETHQFKQINYDTSAIRVHSTAKHHPYVINTRNQTSDDKSISSSSM
jgi:hypothetical protein